MSLTPMKNEITLEELQAAAFTFLCMRKANNATKDVPRDVRMFAFDTALHTFLNLERQFFGDDSNDARMSEPAALRAEKILNGE